MLSADGMDRPCLAAVDSAMLAPDADPTGPLLLDAGRLRLAPTPLRRLCMREFERTNASRAAMLERLARAAEGGRNAELTAGLALFYRMQEVHSPFESKEQNLRLPDEVLELLESAALREAPNEFLRQLWESLARVLGGKRWIEQIYRFVEPLATKYAPWPALERVLAMADLESLEPQSARKRLEALSVHEPASFEIWYYLGEAQTQLGDHQGACSSWKRALELMPEHELTRRKLAMALVRAGDPEGVKRVNELLAEEPEDEELRVFLGPGPYPVPAPTFSPGGHAAHPDSK
jgi:tetratricopeptide (TPR) repeat protein